MMVKEKEWFKAIRNGHVHVIINLLNAIKEKKTGKNLDKLIHSVDGQQSTALHLACQYNHCDLVKILLESGASPNVLDQSECTALHMAAWNGNEEICEIIKKSTQDPVKINAKNAAGETALHLASQHGHDKVLETLLEMGADAMITNSYGQTSLILACQYGRKDVASALVSRLPPKCKDILYYETAEASPLHVATHNGHAQVVALLLMNGFPVNAKTSNGTCLHEAVQWNRAPVVKILLENDIDVDALDGNGKTAMQLLDKNNQKVAVSMKEMIADHIEKKKSEYQDNGGYAQPSPLVEMGVVLNSMSDMDPSQQQPQKLTRPSTPELMRRLSSKYRKKYEEICTYDSDIDIEVEDDDDFGRTRGDDVFASQRS